MRPPPPQSPCAFVGWRAAKGVLTSRTKHIWSSLLSWRGREASPSRQGSLHVKVERRRLAELWIAPRDPLYLFACSMLWHAEADVGAGWELVGGLRSLRQEERIVSAALLARTKSLNLPVDESWWRNGDPDLPHKEPESRRDSRAVNKVMTMK